MNSDQHAQLRELLAAEVAGWQPQTDFIRDISERLDEDNGQFFMTTAEQQVFNLDADLFPTLYVAYQAYEVLMGVAMGVMPKETEALIREARSICPPARFYDFEQPWTERCSEQQWFVWLAGEFFGLSIRQSSAYYDKRSYNLIGVTIFFDEKADNVHHLARDPDTGELDDIPF